MGAVKKEGYLPRVWSLTRVQLGVQLSFFFHFCDNQTPLVHTISFLLDAGLLPFHTYADWFRGIWAPPSLPFLGRISAQTKPSGSPYLLLLSTFGNQVSIFLCQIQYTSSQRLRASRCDN